MLGVSLCAVIGGLFALRGTTAPKVVSVNGGLIVDHASLDFGTVFEQNNFVLPIRVKNPTANAVQVDGVKTSCVCTSVEPKEFAVEPWGEKIIHVSLELTSHAGDSGSALEKPTQFSASLVPQIANAGATKLDEWRIVGQVRKALKVENGFVDLGDVSVLDERNVSAGVRVMCVEPVASLAASCDPAFGEVHDSTLAGPSGFREIQFTLAKGLPLGPFQTSLQLVPVEGEGKSLPPISVPVVGRMVEDIQFFPAEVALGAVKLGESESETVELRSLSGRVIAVESADGVVDGLNVDTERLPGQSGRCRLVMRPSRLGAISSKVNFTVRSGDKTVIVPLRVTCIGLPKADAVSRQASGVLPVQLGSEI